MPSCQPLFRHQNKLFRAFPRRDWLFMLGLPALLLFFVLKSDKPMGFLIGLATTTDRSESSAA